MIRENSVEIAGRTVECVGRWPRLARLRDEPWLEPPLPGPAQLAEALRGSRMRADVFTVAQSVEDPEPRHAAPFTWDSLAVADTGEFDPWWNELPQETRKHVRRARKAGLIVRPVPFDDPLVAGISRLYNETPVRQGRRFPHHGKPLTRVRRENATYLARSHFLGAFLGDELVGFLKLVRVGTSARIMQILAAQARRDTFATQALLAAAVELCPRIPARRLIYGQYVYGRKHGSSMTEFKRRNGFREVRVPRYHFPLTWRGHLALKGGFHRPAAELIPEPVFDFLLKLRAFALSRRLLRPAA